MSAKIRKCSVRSILVKPVSKNHKCCNKSATLGIAAHNSSLETPLNRPTMTRPLRPGYTTNQPKVQRYLFVGLRPRHWNKSGLQKRVTYGASEYCATRSLRMATCPTPTCAIRSSPRPRSNPPPLPPTVYPFTATAYDTDRCTYGLIIPCVIRTHAQADFQACALSAGPRSSQFSLPHYGNSQNTCLFIPIIAYFALTWDPYLNLRTHRPTQHINAVCTRGISH